MDLNVNQIIIWLTAKLPKIIPPVLVMSVSLQVVCISLQVILNVVLIQFWTARPLNLWLIILTIVPQWSVLNAKMIITWPVTLVKLEKFKIVSSTKVSLILIFWVAIQSTIMISVLSVRVDTLEPTIATMITLIIVLRKIPDCSANLPNLNFLATPLTTLVPLVNNPIMS